MVGLLCKMASSLGWKKDKDTSEVTPPISHRREGEHRLSQYNLQYAFCFLLQPVYDKRKVIAILPYSQIPETDELRWVITGCRVSYNGVQSEL